MKKIGSDLIGNFNQNSGKNNEISSTKGATVR